MPAIVLTNPLQLNYTSGVGIPYKLVLSGTAGSGNTVTQNVTQSVDGNTFTQQFLKNPEFYLKLASTSDTCQLTVAIQDCFGNAATVDASNTVTYSITPTGKLSTASVPAGTATSTQVAEEMPVITSMSNTGSPTGTELVSFSAATMSTNWEPSTLKWTTQNTTVSYTGLVSAVAVGYDQVEVRYPLASNDPLNPQFICALLNILVL
jgi:hypothetical protein